MQHPMTKRKNAILHQRLPREHARPHQLTRVLLLQGSSSGHTPGKVFAVQAPPRQAKARALRPSQAGAALKLGQLQDRMLVFIHLNGWMYVLA